MGAANTLDNVGSIHHDTGQPAQALQVFNQSLRLREEAGTSRVRRPPWVSSPQLKSRKDNWMTPAVICLPL